MISAHEFLQSLMAGGEARVLAPGEPPDDVEWNSALEVVEASWRLHVPSPVPEFHLPTARWAARILYRAFQFLLWRDAGAELVKKALTVAAPDCPDQASRLYSADLCLRYLPSLLKLAARLSPDDVLVHELHRIAREWPLSSAGIPGLEPPPDLSAVMAHSGLRCLFTERLIAAGDRTLLTDPAAADAVREALGAHPELAPALASSLISASAAP
jgi:hypothetical protein